MTSTLRWGWVVSTTSRPPHPRERPGTHCTGDWVGPQGRSGRVRKISPPTRIRSPDRPARSESLYRLSYPGPYFRMASTVLIRIFKNPVVIEILRNAVLSSVFSQSSRRLRRTDFFNINIFIFAT